MQGLDEWATEIRWTLTVPEAEHVAAILEPLGTGCEMSGDTRPR